MAEPISSYPKTLQPYLEKVDPASWDSLAESYAQCVRNVVLICKERADEPPTTRTQADHDKQYYEVPSKLPHPDRATSQVTYLDACAEAVMNPHAPLGPEGNPGGVERFYSGVRTEMDYQGIKEQRFYPERTSGMFYKGLDIETAPTKTCVWQDSKRFREASAISTRGNMGYINNIADYFCPKRDDPGNIGGKRMPGNLQARYRVLMHKDYDPERPYKELKFQSVDYLPGANYCGWQTLASVQPQNLAASLLSSSGGCGMHASVAGAASFVNPTGVLVVPPAVPVSVPFSTPAVAPAPSFVTAPAM